MIYTLSEQSFLARTNNYKYNKQGELVIDYKKPLTQEERISRIKQDVMNTCYVPKGINSINVIVQG